ncbi:chaplin [Streptomyces sp. NPDC101165]|uniref:chaplin n=1 Tax=Streptomyces sp. NPDC101165 TaxID=3366119 RepID=UPI00380B123B
MTAEKGKSMKKSAAVVAGAILALGGAAPAFADAGATGAASNSPGVLSGNVIEVPVHVPVNACGDSVDVIGLLNPAFGNACVNG